MFFLKKIKFFLTHKTFFLAKKQKKDKLKKHTKVFIKIMCRFFIFREDKRFFLSKEITAAQNNPVLFLFNIKNVCLKSNARLKTLFLLKSNTQKSLEKIFSTQKKSRMQAALFLIYRLFLFFFLFGYYYQRNRRHSYSCHQRYGKYVAAGLIGRIRQFIYNRHHKTLIRRYIGFKLGK